MFFYLWITHFRDLVNKNNNYFFKKLLNLKVLYLFVYFFALIIYWFIDFLAFIYQLLIFDIYWTNIKIKNIVKIIEFNNNIFTCKILVLFLYFSYFSYVLLIDYSFWGLTEKIKTNFWKLFLSIKKVNYGR